MQLLDGKFISNKIKEEIREEVEALKKMVSVHLT